MEKRRLIRLPDPGGVSPAELYAAFRMARRLWNEGRYWDVHEALEEPWRRLKGCEKEWVQAVILAAAAGVHLQKANHGPVRGLLDQAVRRAVTAPDDFGGWTFKKFKRWLAQATRAEPPIFPTM